MERGGDALLLEYRRKSARLAHVAVVVAGRDHDLGLPERREQALIFERRQECERIDEVRLALTPAIEPRRRVVRAGEADGLLDQARSSRRERERGERAEGCADS